MKTLAEQNPNLVKPLTLPFKTLTGMSVQGIEITEDVTERDGKPVFLQMGVHHAREWPSAENAFEFAYELVKGYKAGDARVRRLMKSSRVIVVPDRQPRGLQHLPRGRPGPGRRPAAGRATTPPRRPTWPLFQYEYQRKNCRVNSFDPAVPGPRAGRLHPAAGHRPGRSSAWTPTATTAASGAAPARRPAARRPPAATWRRTTAATAPFSERESQNIRALVSARHVTTLITNHTFSNLVLRPPGIQSQGPPVDEAVYKALGDSMAANNAYTSQPSYMLYDTTGGTEDWTYYATGGLGFTFEIGLNGFHPPYAETIAEYEGTAPAAGAGKGGNREAYFKALENTAASARHSTLTGKAPPGTVLRLKKSFTTETSPVIDQNGDRGRGAHLPATRSNTTMVTPFAGTLPLGHQPVHAADRGAGQGPARHRQPERPESTSAARRRRPPCPRRQPGQPDVLQRLRVHGPGRRGHRQRQGHGRRAVEQPGDRLRHHGLRGHQRRRPVGGRDQGRRHLGAGPDHQRDHLVRRARRGHRRQALRGADRQLPRRRELHGQRHLRRPAAVQGRPPRRAGRSPASRRRARSAPPARSRSTAARARTVDFSKACAAVGAAGCACPPRAAPRAPASAPPAWAAPAPSSARRSRARCCRTARASTATA